MQTKVFTSIPQRKYAIYGGVANECVLHQYHNDKTRFMNVLWTMVFYIFFTTKITRFIDIVGTNVIDMKSTMNKHEQSLTSFPKTKNTIYRGSAN